MDFRFWKSYFFQISLFGKIEFCARLRSRWIFLKHQNPCFCPFIPCPHKRIRIIFLLSVTFFLGSLTFCARASGTSFFERCSSWFRPLRWNPNSYLNRCPRPTRHAQGPARTPPWNLGPNSFPKTTPTQKQTGTQRTKTKNWNFFSSSPPPPTFLQAPRAPGISTAIFQKNFSL